jgi:hypothetical protein
MSDMLVQIEDMLTSIRLCSCVKTKSISMEVNEITSSNNKAETRVCLCKAVIRIVMNISNILQEKTKLIQYFNAI